MTVDHPRRVRSFVRRPGRITTGQQRALAELMPRWGIPRGDDTIDLDRIFGRQAPRVLEIGFGDGASLVTAAARHPGIDYLGIEVHDPGIGHLLALIERAALTNIRIVAGDAVDVVEAMLPAAGFDAVNLFFPDPWPKKRHHKRRIVKTAFVEEVARILKPSGLLHIATDWANYAEQIVEVIGASPRFAAAGELSADEAAIAFRAPTKFEQRGLRLGHEVADFVFRRTAGAD